MEEQELTLFDSYDGSEFYVGRALDELKYSLPGLYGLPESEQLEGLIEQLAAFKAQLRDRLDALIDEGVYDPGPFDYV